MGKIKGIIIATVMVVLIGGYFFYISNMDKKTEETTVTAVKEVILKNLDNSYPPTPKEVVKYYSDITKCLYNEEYSNEEFEQMADKLLAIYDDELAAEYAKKKHII